MIEHVNASLADRLVLEEMKKRKEKEKASRSVTGELENVSGTTLPDHP